MSSLHLFLTGVLLLGAPNPILPGVADAGVLRYAGTYYLMGVGTSGAMYTSDDLVHWAGPEHAFSMHNAWATGPAATDDNIHACDLLLRNGTFHLFWSVNHGELRQIGHATADAPAGPYREPNTDLPFDGRIDPQCFQDEGGDLYFYSVKFSAGNVIWGQPMTHSGALTGEPKPLLTAMENTWETLDKPFNFRVNEGPHVSMYRGQYYMVYNANHTSPRFGHYALGVAEAVSPLAFSNDSKYAFPVLRSNRDPKHAAIEPDAAVPEVKNCGQPSLVRGPNGIEWWLVYFADHDRRSQCIDRVHFLGNELYVEGPSSAATPGYHPHPALPSFRDLFQGEEPIAGRWDTIGTWQKQQGALHADIDSVPAFARARVPAARSYLLETVFRTQSDAAGRLGLLAWDNGQGASLCIGIDREKGVAFRSFRRNKRSKEHVLPLPRDFNWRGPHTLRVENNEGNFRILLDERLLDFPQARITGGSAGAPGLFAAGASASFESFIWTRGWDEWGTNIQAWTGRTEHAKSGGKNGLTLHAGQSLFKGDLLPQYEFATQIQAEKSGGIYPVYIDDRNYLMAFADAGFTRLTITGKRNGQDLPKASFSVRPRIHRAHDASSSGYNLRTVKLKDRVVFFAEGRELGETEGNWPESRVGLFASEGACTFDGLTRYELP